MYDEKRRNGELAAAREDGIAEGREEANMEVARKMLAAGIPVDHIVQFTGLDREIVEKL